PTHLRPGPLFRRTLESLSGDLRDAGSVPLCQAAPPRLVGSLSPERPHVPRVRLPQGRSVYSEYKAVPWPHEDVETRFPECTGRPLPIFVPTYGVTFSKPLVSVLTLVMPMG